MTKETTNTSMNILTPEGHYEIATVESVKKKIVKEIFTIYNWRFSASTGGKVLDIKLDLFPSAMGDLLRALGATETSKDKFDWDTEEVVGKHVSFNVVHVDVKGTLRAQISDVKPATYSGEPLSKQEVQWGE